MLEANEDFEIIIDGEPVSFHQVKAYNSSTFDEYSDALFGLTIELYKRKDVKGFIHTWKEINDRPEFNGLIESVKNDFTKVFNEFKDAKPKSGNTIIETAAAGGKTTNKKSSILRAALPGLDANALSEAIEEIAEVKNDALNRLACYKYENKTEFCDLDDINEYIKKELSIALDARGTTTTQEQLEKAFNYFLGVIDNYIIERHKAKTTSDAEPIKFSKIIEALSIDHEDIGKNYVALRFKDRFACLIDDYLGTEEDYPMPQSPQPCNLKAAQKLLLSLSPLELWEHYRHFSPQLQLASENNTDNAFSVSEDGIRDHLLKILHGINFSRIYQDAERLRFSYKCSKTPPQGYLPTTITTNVRISRTFRQLNSNPCLGELLYEIRNLIHCGEEAYLFEPDIEKNTKAPPSTEDSPRAKRDDVLPSITLLPLNAAKGLLAE